MTHRTEILLKQELLIRGADHVMLPRSRLGHALGLDENPLAEPMLEAMEIVAWPWRRNIERDDRNLVDWCSASAATREAQARARHSLVRAPFTRARARWLGACMHRHTHATHGMLRPSKPSSKRSRCLWRGTGILVASHGCGGPSFVNQTA